MAGGLDSALGGNGQRPPASIDFGDLDEGEVRLFEEMRKRMRDGAEVTFKEDHEGNLIAIESVLHRPSDFEPSPKS